MGGYVRYSTCRLETGNFDSCLNVLCFCFCDVVSWFKGGVGGRGVHELIELCLVGVLAGDGGEGVLVGVLDVGVLEPLGGVGDGVVGGGRGVGALPRIRTGPAAAEPALGLVIVNLLLYLLTLLL